MPKNIEDIKEEDSNNYYLCVLCKKLYTVSEIIAYGHSYFLGECKNCREYDNEIILKKRNKIRHNEMVKFLKENPE